MTATGDASIQIWIVLEGLLLIHGGRFAGSVGEVLVDPHVAKRWNWVI
jgi:hypothetical protein